MNNNFDFNQAIETALRTWYPEDHPLHLEIHHPLGKLVGEMGELLDDYMKSLYKPGYKFEPLDELGDVWYYFRVLCYQFDYTPSKVIDYSKEHFRVDFSLGRAIGEAAEVFSHSIAVSITPGNSWKMMTDYMLTTVYFAIIKLCKEYNFTLVQLTQSNWDKLKPGSERGEQWMKARGY